MAKVQLFTDSISDIPQEWIDTYNIGIIPLYIVFGSMSYRDRVDIDTHQMYKRVEEEGRLPKTAAPSPLDFMNQFAAAIANGDDVLYISMSSKLSSTYQNATLAAKEYPPGRVRIFDSMNISAGMAMHVLIAARMAAKGESVLAIVQELELIRNQVQMNVLVNSLDYLHKGGRVGNLQHMLGSMLRVRPVLYVTNGIVLSGAKYRGSQRKIIRNLVNSILEHMHQIEPAQFIIAQTMEEDTANWLRSMILEETEVREVHIIEGGCAICSHSGPQSLAISFVLKH
ncbi:DegV family protein [Paenibacillus hubeiensis]|uniref:DegV family protein n=1 Tax=Paenibacillus hubeiensis TaxID=3077330 RepID=UPI0031BA3B56